MQVKLLALFPFIVGLLGTKVQAQQKSVDQNGKKEIQEIIIRKSGDGNADMNLKIIGDSIIVNGKPMIEFSNDSIKVSGRTITFGRNYSIFDSSKIVRGLGIKNLSWKDLKLENGKQGVKIAAIDKNKDLKSDDIKERVKGGLFFSEDELQEGDIITSFNGTSYKKADDLKKAFENFKGDEIKISLLRDKKNIELARKIKSYTNSFSFNSPDGKSFEFTTPNFNFDDLKGNFNFDLGDKNFPDGKMGLKVRDTKDSKGVEIIEIEKDSRGEKAGFKVGDIITEINDKTVKNTDDVRIYFTLIRFRRTAFPVKIIRDGKEQTINVSPEIKTVEI